VSHKPRAWLIAVGIAAVCGASVWGVASYRARSLTTAALLRRMPAEDALVAYIDFSELRRGGVLQLLDGSKAGEDPEYPSFVRQTQFDYKKDLDAALVAFAPTGRFLLAQGALRLEEPARVRGKPARQLRQRVLPHDRPALRSGASRSSPCARTDGAGGEPPTNRPPCACKTRSRDRTRKFPPRRFGLSVPTSMLKSGDSLPPAPRMFASGMERAETVTLSFAPEGHGLAARLEVRCRDDRDAADLASQLTHTTSLLREMMERGAPETQPRRSEWRADFRRLPE